MIRYFIKTVFVFALAPFILLTFAVLSEEKGKIFCDSTLIWLDNNGWFK